MISHVLASGCAAYFLLFVGHRGWRWFEELRWAQLRREDSHHSLRNAAALNQTKIFARAVADRDWHRACYLGGRLDGSALVAENWLRDELARIEREMFTEYPATLSESRAFRIAYDDARKERLAAFASGAARLPVEGPQLPMHLGTAAFVPPAHARPPEHPGHPACGWRPQSTDLSPRPDGFDPSAGFVASTFAEVNCENCLVLFERAQAAGVVVLQARRDGGAVIPRVRSGPVAWQALEQMAGLPPVLAERVNAVTEAAAPVPAGTTLSVSVWNSTAEATDLMRHAAPLIRREHLALVLAEICETVWPHWEELHPDDWQLAWCITALRAWAMGEATIDDLRTSVLGLDADGVEITTLCNDSDDAYADYSDSQMTEEEGAGVAVAVARSVRAVDALDVAAVAVGVVEAAAFARAGATEAKADRHYGRWVEAFDADERSDDSSPDETEERYAAREERWAAVQQAGERTNGAWRRGFLGSLAASATIMRSSIPYRTTRAISWSVERGIVVTGNSLLRLDGWRIADAVLEEQLPELRGERAVAFDEAQERTGFVLYRRPMAT